MTNTRKGGGRLSAQFTGGVSAGIGIGLVCSVIIYRRFLTSDIERALPLVSFAFLCIGFSGLIALENANSLPLTIDPNEAEQSASAESVGATSLPGLKRLQRPRFCCA